MTNNSGVGVITLTTLTFFVLKLTHVINWSWWWVFAPLWIYVLVATAVATLLFLVLNRE